MNPGSPINRKELAAVVYDMGITLGVLQDLYSIAVDVTRTDAQKASSMFVAIDRYMDDLGEAHSALEHILAGEHANAKGGA